MAEHKELEGVSYKLVKAPENDGVFMCTGCMFDSGIAIENGIVCSLIHKDRRYTGGSLGCTDESTGDYYIFKPSMKLLFNKL